MPVLVRQTEDLGPHVRLKTLLAEALADAVFAPRYQGFTYYREQRALLIHVDQVLDAGELAALEALLAAHAGEP